MLRLHAAPTPDTDALLTRAMSPDPQRIQAALHRYRTDPDWQLHTWEVAGQGHARALLHALMGTLDLHSLTADTDDDAADFYRRSGFHVQEIPSPWDRRRSRCTLTREG
ncbi:GNAT family N-acetyltransferase [Deinococcus sp. PEB2-63]